MNNPDKKYLIDAVDELKRYAGADSVLDKVCYLLSEDALHELVAAMSEYYDYPLGVDYWYGDRGNYIERDWFLE